MPVMFFWPIMATYFYTEWMRECRRIMRLADSFPAHQAEILFFPERNKRA